MAELPAGFRVVSPKKPASALPEGFRVVPQAQPAPPQDPYDNLPVPGNPTFHPEDPDDWERGLLLPIERNRKTGAYRAAVPGFVEGMADAAALPGDVATGKVDPMSDEGIKRGIGFATTFTPGSPSLPVKPFVNPKQLVGVEAKQAADQFGIPLTKGQATADLATLQKEELLRQGNGGASSTMRQFDQSQQEAIGAAVDDVGTKMGANAEAMPEAVAGAVRDKVAFDKQQAGALYDIAFDGGLEIMPEALRQLPGFVQTKLADEGVIVDAGITPVATQALKEIEAAGALEGALRPAAPGVDAAADDVTGVSLKGLEQIRKRLVGLKGSTPEDTRAVSAIKRSFDAWLDDGVDNMLISGDDAALAALKKARESVTAYKTVTAPAPGDAVAQTMKKMLNEETTAAEVANWLYGADVVSPSLNAPKMAARIRNMVGTDSTAWKSVKAAAWDRIVKDLNTGDPRSVVQMVKRIEGFLNNKGSSLARIVFTSDERKMMAELAQSLKKTITPHDAKNPSRSGYTIAGMVENIGRVGAVLAGMQATNSWEGALLAAVAYPVFKDALRSGSAKSAVKGVSVPKPASVAKPGFELGGNALARGTGATAGDDPKTRLDVVVP